MIWYHIVAYLEQKYIFSFHIYIYIYIYKLRGTTPIRDAILIENGASCTALRCFGHHFKTKSGSFFALVFDFGHHFFNLGGLGHMFGRSWRPWGAPAALDRLVGTQMTSKMDAKIEEKSIKKWFKISSVFAKLCNIISKGFLMKNRWKIEAKMMSKSINKSS